MGKCKLCEKPGISHAWNHRSSDRCVCDPHLFDALEYAVKNALRQIPVDQITTDELETLQRWYGRRHGEGVDLSSENMVQDFLRQSWLAA